MQLLSAILALTSLATASVYPRQTSSGACNNSPSLCSKAYNSITHLGAHDSPFVRDATTDYSSSGNQYYNSTVQLSAGVRLLSAQIHNSNSDQHLCHTSCDLLDAGLLSTWLTEIKGWLDSNPNEVVTLLLVNSDNNDAATLGSHFEKSGINKYAYTPTSTTSAIATWPTLQDLISANKRLITFIASLSPPSTIPSQYSYLLDEFTFLFENSFDNTKFTDFSCQPNRPSSVSNNVGAALSANLLPMINHFLDEDQVFGIQTPDLGNITTTNADGDQVGMLGQSARSCQQLYSKAPNFLLVDFFDQGPAINTVDELNGVTNAVGRVSPPPRDMGESSSDRKTATFEGVTELVQQVKMGEKPKLGAWIWGAGKWSWGGINLSGGSLTQ